MRVFGRLLREGPMRNERAGLEWTPTTFPSRRCPPQPFCAGTAPERSNPDGCGRAAAIGVSGSQVIGTEAPADPMTSYPRGAVRWLLSPIATRHPPAPGIFLPYPRCTPRRAKKPCSAKDPPSMHCAPGGTAIMLRKTPRRCIAHRGAPPLGSDQDPSRSRWWWWWCCLNC